ncbi:SPX domain-containing protein 4-like isoform X1 [Zingiber officinale]|uniref:SPX domain-containing protein 4-like isoform X1 n=1 Tax=Zingiber officinale TaxID=94328 RepID=UPI001C4B0677|nr:SPX domain-containing protein 4-like isoform X1 [Zingiber officinale]
MKFGKDFRNHLDETLPEWRDKFLAYKTLKKLIKHLPQPPPLPEMQDEPLNPAAAAPPLVVLEAWFVRILDEELEKFNDFYVDKEEDFVIRLQEGRSLARINDVVVPKEQIIAWLFYCELYYHIVIINYQELKERIERIRTSRNRAFSSEREFSEEMLEIRKAFVTIHGEMVLLKNYSSLNFAGLVKILKKYDKRTGGWLRLPFTQRALHQPFFTTEPLTRLVHECEANLELLFPLEPEVVEPNQDEAHQQRNPEVSPIRADFVYRSTLAALRAIQGLRRASSTYNPLSLAQFFHGEGADNEYGAVTSENSTSNSLTTSQNNEADYGTDD